METMHFHIVHTKIVLRTTLFDIKGVPLNNLAPMINCPVGVQGRLDWMLEYLPIDDMSAILTELDTICTHKRWRGDSTETGTNDNQYRKPQQRYRR